MALRGQIKWHRGYMFNSVIFYCNKEQLGWATSSVKYWLIHRYRYVGESCFWEMEIIGQLLVQTPKQTFQLIQSIRSHCLNYKCQSIRSHCLNYKCQPIRSHCLNYKCQSSRSHCLNYKCQSIRSHCLNYICQSIRSHCLNYKIVSKFTPVNCVLHWAVTLRSSHIL